MLLVLLGAGCPAASPVVPDPRPRPVAPAGDVVLRALSPAASYELRAPAVQEGLEARLYALVVAAATGQGKPAPETDQGAAGAARDICRGLLVDAPPPAALVDFALRANGLVDPPPHLIIAGVPGGSEAPLLEQLGPRLTQILGGATFTRVGIAVATPQRTPGQKRLVVALFDGRIRFRPLPRFLWSRPDRFCRGLVQYFNKYPKW